MKERREGRRVRYIYRWLEERESASCFPPVWAARPCLICTIRANRTRGNIYNGCALNMAEEQQGAAARTETALWGEDGTRWTFLIA